MRAEIGGWLGDRRRALRASAPPPVATSTASARTTARPRDAGLSRRGAGCGRGQV